METTVGAKAEDLINYKKDKSQFPLLFHTPTTTKNLKVKPKLQS